MNLSGGTLRFDTYRRTSGGHLNFIGGTVKLAGDRATGTDAEIQDIFGATPTITTGKTLAFEGTATPSPSSRVILAGGTLSAPTLLISPGSRLSTSASSAVQGAVLGLTGSEIDATGGNLTIGDGTKVISASTITAPFMSCGVPSPWPMPMTPCLIPRRSSRSAVVLSQAH